MDHDTSKQNHVRKLSQMHLKSTEMLRAPKWEVRWAIDGSTWADPAAQGKNDC